LHLNNIYTNSIQEQKKIARKKKNYQDIKENESPGKILQQIIKRFQSLGSSLKRLGTTPLIQDINTV